jgi:uncharacterized repeat protein (TIGR02543 family)
VTTSRTRFGAHLATIAGLVAVMLVACGAAAWGADAALISVGAPSGVILASTDHVSVPFTITRDSSTPPLMAFSVVFKVSEPLMLPSDIGSIHQGTFLPGGSSFQLIDMGVVGSDHLYTADGSTLGSPCGTGSLSGTLFTVDLNATHTGTGTVSIVSVKLRDCSNDDITPTIGTSSTVLADLTVTLTINQDGSGDVTQDPTPVGGRYEKGTAVSLTAAPAACWTFTEWTGDLTGSTSPTTITMTGDKTVTAHFALQTFTITASAGTGGSISPSGAVSVNCGANQTFSISASSGYYIAAVLVDEIPVGTVTSYTFTNVQATHTIAASFTDVPPPAERVAAAPASGTEITTLTPCVTVPVVITRTNPTPLRGFSVTLQLSPNLTLCGASFVSAGYPRAPRSFHVTPASGNRWIIDDVTLGTPCGATGSGTLFTVDVTGPGADGTGTITIESVQARDCVNAPIAVLPGPPATIPIHRMGPTRTTNLTAVQVTTGNHVPPPAVHATTPIKLQFTVPADAASVEVYRKSFGGYPQYEENGGVAPTLPTYPLDGTWTRTAVTASGQTDEPPARDFWYYVLVSKDAYGNASAVSNMTPGTLDYSLGDVSDGTTACAGDDQVNTADVSLLGSNYGITPPLNGALECLDVGPTVDYSVNARPQTDNKVDFEDLMMFSLNYGMVSAPQTAAQPAQAAATLDASEQLGLWAPTLVTASETFRVVLGLQGTGSLQGISVRLGWNPAVATPVSVASGGLFEGVGGVMLHVGLTTVDAALLGVRETGLARGGAFATVMFQAVATGNPAIEAAEIKGRDRQNHPMDVPVVNAVGVDEPLVRTQFAPARPTPFSSSTTLEFSLASRGEVELAVFGVDGRRVRTLVKGTQEPGVHRLAWNGTDDQGQRLPAGMYYARLTAGRERFTRTLLRLGR